MTTKEALETAKCLDGFEDLGYMDGSGAELKYWYRQAAKTIRELVFIIESLEK